ncbi:hypothetical protein LTR50_000787 [Elasticomyces elasticus]|nr:hypothetical protein LTR50_000787 [Elasticomyces elasticus]
MLHPMNVEALQITPRTKTKNVTMRLYAIADLHLTYEKNSEAFAELSPVGHSQDGLILAGDVGESLEHLRQAFSVACGRFKHVWWVPGNHELYNMPLLAEESHLKGEAKYHACVAVAREYGVLTPEDDFATWNGEGGPAIIAPVFTLYDYSFRPDHVSRDEALDWAMEEGIRATDEARLHPDPYITRDIWCTALITRCELKLQQAADTGLPLVIINHWPLRQDLVFIPAVPRFSIWCGSKKTEDWHRRFNAKVVVTGHLHVRRSDWIDGTRFEECSLGYPRQWQEAKDKGVDINMMLREILPGPPAPPSGSAPTLWRQWG